MSLDPNCLWFRNQEAIQLESIPMLLVSDFQNTLIHQLDQSKRIVSFFGVPQSFFKNNRPSPSLVQEKGTLPIFLYAIIADDLYSHLGVFACHLEGPYPSLSERYPQLSLFERELAEQCGVMISDHPWLKPVRFPNQFPFSINPDHGRIPTPIGDIRYFSIEGNEVHEVAVGPVHAGVIEPGHFRFICQGETVLHLEISLGYQHRGVEETFLEAAMSPLGVQKNLLRTMHLIETVAGDTSIGHGIAYCQAIEALSHTTVPIRALCLRSIALELERCANHTGDLGALSGDVGYLPTQSFCGRIRGDFLNMSALLCGSRFGRGFLIPGGVRFDLEPHQIALLESRLIKAKDEVTHAVELMLNDSTVLSRFENIGILPKELCEHLGIVGLVARSSAVHNDIRRDFPFGAYRFTQIPIVSGLKGDIYDRAMVRFREIGYSIEFILSQLHYLPGGPIVSPLKKFLPNRFVCSLTEGWRGEIVHVAMIDDDERWIRYKIIDPSFHNWMGLAMTLRSMQISDFPLCNKSFNLSYCGFDL